MRIAIAGSGALAWHVTAPILESDHELVAVVQDGRKNRGLRRAFVPWLASFFAASGTAVGYAKRHGIPIVYIDTMSESELKPLRDLNIDLLIVAGFAIILKRPILELPRIGCVNCHPSLLPLHRGPNPFTAVVLANRRETGVTFHVMEETIDTGDILKQATMELTGTETAGDVYKNTAAVAGTMVPDLLDHIEAHGLTGTPQDNSGASYDKKLKPEEFFIDWTKPADEVHRHIRACLPFMLPRFRDGNRTVYVTRAEMSMDPVEQPPGTIVGVIPRTKIATGYGTITLGPAVTTWPFPWIWPPRIFGRRRPGDKVG